MSFLSFFAKMNNEGTMWPMSAVTTTRLMRAFLGESQDANENVANAQLLITEALSGPLVLPKQGKDSRSVLAPVRTKMPGCVRDAEGLYLHACLVPEATPDEVRERVAAIARKKSLGRLLRTAGLMYDRNDSRLGRYLVHWMKYIDAMVNTCCDCNVPLGPANGRQLCGKWECRHLAVVGQERLQEIAFLHDVKLCE